MSQMVLLDLIFSGLQMSSSVLPIDFLLEALTICLGKATQHRNVHLVVAESRS